MIEYRLRQTDIIKEEELKRKVYVIGAGAIGSFVTLSLAKMGFEDITVFDHDVVDTHNISNQFYRIADIGQPKVLALQDIVKQYAGFDLVTHNEKYVRQDLSDIVVSAVDSMDCRVNIWKVIKNNPGIKLYVDGRMSAEYYKVFSIIPISSMDAVWYEKELYPDADVTDAERCTARTILDTVLNVSATMCNQIRKFCINNPYKATIQCDIKNYNFTAF